MIRLAPLPAESELAEQEKTSAEQARVLKLQAQELQESLDERKRQSAIAHRAQAAMVFLTNETYTGRGDSRGATAYGDFIGASSKPPSVTATAHNTSSQPIYDAELLWHGGFAERDLNPEPLGTLMPGQTRTSERDYKADTPLKVFAPFLIFRDATGTWWMRNTNGDLTEQPARKRE